VVDSMTAGEALEIYDLLDSGGVRCWVMGGWGVDALLGFTTRSHKDLDLLVHRADLAAYCAITREAGFGRKLEWEESRPVVVNDVAYDSAFVDAHPDGREVDVHVVDIDDEGAVVQFHEGPWSLPADTLSGRGTLAGRALRCASRSAQLAMHLGYQLPDTHHDDVRLLRDLAR
jgi:lincosamide nucleotidyltransferase A/C/D/E